MVFQHDLQFKWYIQGPAIQRVHSGNQSTRQCSLRFWIAHWRNATFLALLCAGCCHQIVPMTIFFQFLFNVWSPALTEHRFAGHNYMFLMRVLSPLAQCLRGVLGSLINLLEWSSCSGALDFAVWHRESRLFLLLCCTLLCSFPSKLCSYSVVPSKLLTRICGRANGTDDGPMWDVFAYGAGNCSMRLNFLINLPSHPAYKRYVSIVLEAVHLQQAHATSSECQLSHRLWHILHVVQIGFHCFSPVNDS